MTKEQFSLIVKALKAVYSEPTFIPDKDAFEVWYALLSDLDYELANKATQKLMMQSAKTPRPSDIREMAMSFSYKDEMSEMEVWGLVAKAIRNSTYHSEEEFEKLPEIAKKAVGSSQQLNNWACDEEYNEGVIQSNFLRSYRICQQREKDDAKLPQYIKDFALTQNNVKEIGTNETHIRR